MSNESAPDHKPRWRTTTVAAAAIVVVGVGAIAFTVSNTSADDDGVSQPPAPTAAPTTALPTTTKAPRTMTYHGIDNVTVTYTLPDGWESEENDGSLVDGGASVVNFWDIDNVYADGCQWTQLDPPLGPAVDDLATVWATLPGFTATTPVDITVDGYAGMRVDYTVPNYATVDAPVGEYNADCVSGRFALWTDTIQDHPGPTFWAQTPMQQNRQWIIDVDGTRLVINEWSEPGTTPEQLAGMDQFLSSLQIS